MLTLHLRNGRFFWGGLVALAVAGLCLGGTVLWLANLPASEPQTVTGLPAASTSLFSSSGNKCSVPSEVARALDIKTAPARKATQPRALPALTGCLALDSNTLARIPPRFPGEIVAIGTLLGNEMKAGAAPGLMSANTAESDRPLRYGDRVKAGQLLAVLWSKDLGEKKSEFVDALCRLKLDREKLERLEKLYSDAATSEQDVREQRSKVQADQVAVDKAERTLRAWRLGDADMASLRSEAAHIDLRPDGGNSDFEHWARVEIRAPADGVILEKNVSLGSLINDTSADLFKIAETKRLMVWAYVYEDDLPLLSRLLKKGPIPWTVLLPSQPKEKGHAGYLEQVGEMIDPNQHTALVMGMVDNSDLEMKVNQYVTIRIELPPEEDEVEIPTAALVEDGRESVVLVQPTPDKLEFEKRKVTVSRRFHDVTYVRGTLQPGERVVISGALLLNDAMND